MTPRKLLFNSLTPIGDLMIKDDQLEAKRVRDRRKALLMVSKRQPRPGVQGTPKASAASLPAVSIQKGAKSDARDSDRPDD